MKIAQLAGFIKYYLTAGNRHAVHSPFIYALAERLRQRNNEPAFQKIEAIRKKLLKDHSVIPVEDLGAGSSGRKYTHRKISAITASSSKSQHHCRLLYTLTSFYKPETVLELGTAAGISTMYLAAGNRNATLTTIEGCKPLCDIAVKNFAEAGLNNISVINESFDTALPRYLSNTGSVDFVFIDGNHRREATVRYFTECLLKSHKYSIFVIDDINWSSEMQEAWKEIISHEKVTASVNLYMMGLVFLNPDLSKEEFILRY